MPVTKRRSPSKLDPTRTTALRQAFAKQLRRKFARIKGRILRWLVDDDNLGLKPRTLNAFCPTGEGGGVDPTCSPGGGGGASLHDVKVIDGKGGSTTLGLKTTLGNMPWGKREAAFIHAVKEESGSLYAGSHERVVKTSDLVLTQPSVLQSVLDHPEKGEGNADINRPIEVIRYKGAHYVQDGAHRVARALLKGSGTVRARVFDLPTLTANAGQFAFATDTDKLKAFQEWLRTQFKGEMLGKTDEELWLRYAADGFKRGAGRAFDDVNGKNAVGGLKPDDFWQGGKDEFLRSAFGRPESVDKIKLLASRSFTDLVNVTDDMATKLGRVLTDGLVTGSHPRDIARDMMDELDIGRNRAELIARTEIIRAHAEGQLDAFDKMGVEEVGVMVEWSTAGDERVCDECEPMEGTVLRVDEAHGMIPRHPNCRCAFIPANVGEDDQGQKRGAGEVKGAIKESRQAGDDDWGPGASISKYRPESLVGNTLYEFSRLRVEALNAFCPTGPGGGIDNTCSPGGGGGGAYSGSLLPVHVVQQAVGNTLKTVKSLGGSTGAKLVEASDGSQWVMKAPGHDKWDHLRNEAEADNIYRAMGVKVPDGGLVETPNGPVKLTKYIEGGSEMGSLSPQTQEHYGAVASHGFVADALMANWDVAGLGKDNLMVKNGEVYRVDNGGALAYRAQGVPKGAGFGPKVTELETLRDPSLNKTSAEVFKSVTNDAINSQIKDILGKKDAILNAATTPATKEILSKRLEHLASKVNNPPSLTSDGHDLKTGEGVTAYLKMKANEDGNQGPAFTGMQLHKFETLNPDGVKNGVFNSHYFSNKTKNDAVTNWLKKVLPPGTVIKVKSHVTAEKVGYKGDGSKAAKPDDRAARGREDLPAPKPAAPAALPKTYGGLQPGHTYENSQGQVKTVESAEHKDGNVHVKFKGEPGQAVVPADKAFKFGPPKAAAPTAPTPTPKAPKVPKAPPAPPPPPAKDFAELKQQWADAHPPAPAKDLSHVLPEIKSGEHVVLPTYKEQELYDKKENEQWAASLSHTESGAVSTWKGSAKSIRASVASGNPDTTAKSFMSAISKSKPWCGVTYRGLSGDYADKLVGQLKAAGVGGEWQETAPHCMTPNPHVGKSFSGGNLMLRVSSRTGRPIQKSDGFSGTSTNGEMEVTGMPGARYKIKGIHSNVKVSDPHGGTSGTIKHVIDLEEIV